MKALFITSIASISAMMSFAYALVSTKQKDNTSRDKEIVKLHQTGSQLAFRALKWGTFYAVTGCSLIIYGGWKLSGANDVIFCWDLNLILLDSISTTLLADFSFSDDTI